MWTRTATRKELVDILTQREIERFSVQEVSTLGLLSSLGEDVQLVWPDDPTEFFSLPTLMLVDRRQQRDFFAWVSTYYQTLRPFTAYCRVLDRQALDSWTNVASRCPQLKRLEDACVGLVLMEAMTYIAGKGAIRDLPRSAFSATYSYAIAKALALGAIQSELDTITTSWTKARNLTRQPARSLRESDLRAVWEIMVALKAERHSAARELPFPWSVVCDAVLNEGDINMSVEASLSCAGFPPGLWKEMNGNRESRVLQFEELLRKIAVIKVDPLIGDFVMGFAASRIAPGTIDHVQLLGPHCRAFPTALLWYGLLAGLHPRSTVRDYAGGLGRRLLRELLRREDILDRPKCDIAINELEVVMSNESQDGDFRLGTQTQLEVEISPCVTIGLRWPSRGDSYGTTGIDHFDVQTALSLLKQLEATLSGKGTATRKKAASDITVHPKKRSYGGRRGPDEHLLWDKRKA